jgi:hypothetical protein
VDPEALSAAGPRGRRRDRPVLDAPDPAGRGVAPASPRLWAASAGLGFVPTETGVVCNYTFPSARTKVVAADVLASVRRRAFHPPADWTSDGHRDKAPLAYRRDRRRPGSRRRADRRGAGPDALRAVAQRPALAGLSGAGIGGPDRCPHGDHRQPVRPHDSLATRAWPAGHARTQQAFNPKGACWLDVQVAPRSSTPTPHSGSGMATINSTVSSTPLHLPDLRNAGLLVRGDVKVWSHLYWLE